MAYHRYRCAVMLLPKRSYRRICNTKCSKRDTASHSMRERNLSSVTRLWTVIT